jgi:hypothetical protein
MGVSQSVVQIRKLALWLKPNELMKRNAIVNYKKKLSGKTGSV